jgi:hypothetical protein
MGEGGEGRKRERKGGGRGGELEEAEGEEVRWMRRGE